MSKNQSVLVVWWPKAAEQTRAEEEGRVPRVRFGVYSPNGTRLNLGTEPANTLPKDLPCLLLLDPSEVALFAVTPPKLSGAKLKEALPFLVEPFLLNEPEENHVSLWPLLPGQTNQQLASVVSKARVRAVVAGARQAGLKISSLSCETLRKPNSGDLVLWLSGGYLLLADGQDPPLVLPADQSELAQAMLARRLSVGTQNTWATPADHQTFQTSLGSLAEQIKTSEKLPLEAPTALLNRPIVSAEDLRRQGMKALQQANNGKRLWLPTAALALVAIVGLNALAWKAQRAEAAIEAQIVATFEQTLPGTPMVADPLVLIEREKRNLSTGMGGSRPDSLSTLLHEVGLAMDTAPFNSMVDFAWADKTLSVRFTANVTDAMQQAALQKLKARQLDGKWLVGAQSNLPVLQVKRGATR